MIKNPGSKNLILICMLFVQFYIQAQPASPARIFSHADSIRGSITAERASWDVMRYDIVVQPDYFHKSIKGFNDISMNWSGQGTDMQIDLQQPMVIDSIFTISKNNEIPVTITLINTLPFINEGNAWHVKNGIQKPAAIRVYFHGNPRVAKYPPWDGGWIFTKDSLGRPWMTVACQGLGASIWYPCKDHQSDEPDRGASLSIVVPDSLTAIGNGRLVKKESNSDGTVTWKWEVKNPINNYNIIPYIGKYVTWKESFDGEKGQLDCNYWVLDYNLEKAKKQFLQARSMLKCFEHWFGPYPFYEDGYKLVESPHLGMEHQSAVAYGNGYRNGYRGYDLSGTGWGMNWDFIIIHESGHEWFGNSITTTDLADMWVHEGFTNYSETIYTECQSGLEAARAYVRGTRKLIKNDSPIIAHYGVNEEGSGDMYYKGGNLIHYVRQLIDDDEKFRMALREMNQAFYHKTVCSSDVESFWSRKAGMDLSGLFDQYLRSTKIPLLEYKISRKKLNYRWSNCLSGYHIPVRVSLNGEPSQWIKPSTDWSTFKFKKPVSSLTVDPDFYINNLLVK
jgi:aminopeptidase N